MGSHWRLSPLLLKNHRRKRKSAKKHKPPSPLSVTLNMSASSRGDKQSFNCKISFKNPSFRRPVCEFRKALLLRCSYFLTRPGSHTVLPLKMKKGKKRNLLIFWGQSCFVRGGLTKFFPCKGSRNAGNRGLEVLKLLHAQRWKHNVWECCSDL